MPAAPRDNAMHVLLVEDDELLRMCLADTLTEAGLRVTEMPNAERALATALTTPAPDLLVSDVNLGPGMDGIALATEAHRRWPLLRVILMSGILGNLIGPRLCPSDWFLLKPFRPDTLLRLIAEVMADGRSQADYRAPAAWQRTPPRNERVLTARPS